MPPKKKSAAKATPTKSGGTRSTGRAAPDTFTAHGKEHESTAAATRPVRQVQQAQPIVPDTAPVRAANPKIAPSTVKYTGRSTPAIANDAPIKRGRGRPPKNATATVPAASAAPSKKRGRPAASAAESTAEEPPKKRGRPAKSTTTAPAKKPGRPAKTAATAPPVKKPGRAAKVGKRGRPAKPQPKETDAVPPEGERPTPKKRGRPPFGGETTKIDEDDGDAADQLEEELLDAAEDEPQEPALEPEDTTRKRKAAAPKKGKAQRNDAVKVEQDETAAASGKQYWLMKAEQDGHDETLANGEVFNTKFTIDDLRAKDVPEPWDGVRNPGAAANMRAMKQGDLAFFYASGGKKPGIVGIMEIVKEHEPDKTAWEENSYGYVPEEKNRGKWCVVHVEYRKKLSKPVGRDELKKHVADGGPLSIMQEFNSARLSVSKVREDEWNFIHSLIEGEDEDEKLNDVLPGAEEQADAAAGESEINGKMTTFETVLQEDSTTIVAEQRNDDIVVEQQEEMEVDLPTLPPTGFAPTAVMVSTEPEITTTDTLFPSGLPSSRPTSRGTAGKGASSSRTGSRAGSLAPPGKTGRARSRSKTPLARGSSAQPEVAPVVEGAAMPAIEE